MISQYQNPSEHQPIRILWRLLSPYLMQVSGKVIIDFMTSPMDNFVSGYYQVPEHSTIKLSPAMTQLQLTSASQSGLTFRNSPSKVISPFFQPMPPPGKTFVLSYRGRLEIASDPRGPRGSNPIIANFVLLTAFRTHENREKEAGNNNIYWTNY